MPDTLCTIERQILAALDEQGGAQTGHVARRVDEQRYARGARQFSGAVRAWLERLQRDGLVGFLDD